MNRRTFTAAMTAGLVALPATSVNAQRNRAASSLIVSETTGAEIDVSQTSFTLAKTLSSDLGDHTFEAIHLENDHGSLWLRFIAGPGRYDFPEASRLNRSYLEDELGDNFEEFGSQEVDGGGWMAFRLGPELNTYHEVQDDAFPDASLWIEVQVFREHYLKTMEEIQAIDLAGMPPFLFLEESDAEGDLFTNTSVRTDTSRLAVPDRTATSRPTAQSSVIDGDDSDVIEAVRAHQAQFHDEKARFDEAVQRVLDEDVVGQAEMEMFTVIMEVMFSWSGYPSTAAELVFSPELSDLESVYLEWADAVGQMGVTLGRWTMGDGEVDAYIEASNAAVQVDRALSAELRTLGAVIKPAVQGFIRSNDDISSLLKRYESGILPA